ncbi:LysM peptidoglycan-binding domain-containing protein [Niallia sp. NCCP-28]|uniref:LysM peptidoglycan-binding domain-containing protein n=1 Tax=Niallia sp. NCCP-28 TaxID=2934712 RepID=UPI0020839CE4|nr:LysM peptidoglycan-binding domain-containing protein [Niallia sp. NCCP-28]GKU81037.1 hypothetical protein NCCP28_04330 [Niallia sp. NCCP-28]
MTREDSYRKQAELQKKRIPRANNIKVEKQQENSKQENSKKELPSRSSVHRKKGKKKKIPTITLLVIIFILLPVALLLVNKTLSNINFSKLVPTEPASKMFEQVNIDKIDEENTKKEEETDPMEEEKQTSQKEEDNKEETNSADQKQTADEAAEKTAESQGTSSQTNSPATGKIVYHEVVQGETLFTISLKYYPSGNGVDLIKQENQLTNNEIMVGQTLKIPLP